MSQSEDELDELLQRGYRYALSLTHDSELAQDILQDACLKLSRRNGPWTIPYLITTIRTSYIDVLRGKRLPTTVALNENDHPAMLEAFVLPTFDVALEDALAQLSDETRELLYLSVVEEYTAQELAILTKRPRGTILSLLYRTKRQLRRLLDRRTLRGDL